MEKKKSIKADLENKKGLFLQIGLVLTLTGILVAFEWKSYDAIDLSALQRQAVAVEEEIVIQTEQNTPPPPPPPPEVTTEIEIVDDTKEIENEVEFTAEIDEKTVVEAYVAPVVEQVEEEEQTIFQVVEVSPDFPGGEKARLEYLSKNIKYPAIARESGIQGTIYVTFVVERDGSITDVKILRGIGGGCDEEALRVVQGMPRWSPGKQRTKAVRVQFSMPIKFTLAG